MSKDDRDIVDKFGEWLYSDDLMEGFGALMLLVGVLILVLGGGLALFTWLEGL